MIGMETGARRMLGTVVVIALLLLIALVIRGMHGVAAIELGVIAAILALILIWRHRETSQLRSFEADSTEMHSTDALRLARKLRTNAALLFLYRALFKVLIPIAFALALVVVGVDLINRVAFDAWSAAGQVCTASLPAEAQKTEKLGTATGFTTDNICWASGLVLKSGKHYRITLTMTDDWKDGDATTTMSGSAPDTFSHWIGIPWRRWWTQNWFKPIAQIGAVGNDEYVLNPLDADATAASGDERVLVSEIVPRTGGELFIYVNDAVVMIPGWIDYFYKHNNHGGASIKVESRRRN